MNKRWLIVNFTFLLLVVVAFFFYYFMFNFQRESDKKSSPPNERVTNFEDCAAAGHPVQESYPRKCTDSAGRSFIENIGNELTKNNLIQLNSPRPNTSVKSPLIIKGRARGNWFFEAQFPVKILDETGKILGTGLAETTSDWMTEKFIDFKAKIVFETPITKKGKLILEKDNPSGLPENADQLEVPVTFD